MITVTEAFELPRPEDIRAMGFVVKLRELDPNSDEAEQQVLVGPEGPNGELVLDWKERFPSLTARGVRKKKAAAVRKDNDVEAEEPEKP
jgi:hypothetical protein